MEIGFWTQAAWLQGPHPTTNCHAVCCSGKSFKQCPVAESTGLGQKFVFFPGSVDTSEKTLSSPQDKVEEGCCPTNNWELYRRNWSNLGRSEGK